MKKAQHQPPDRIKIPDPVHTKLVSLESEKNALSVAAVAKEEEQASILGTLTVLAGAGPFDHNAWDLTTEIGFMIRRKPSGGGGGETGTENVVPIGGTRAQRRATKKNVS